jgi:reactive intermediate/imine deaminase
MRFFSQAVLLLAAVSPTVLATPARLIKHVGNKGELYTAAVATRDLLFVSGTVPILNGTIPEGIEAQTAAAIDNMAVILQEAGTSWKNAVKTTVFLANMDDYEGMNKVYGRKVPSPKPARTSAQASKLPGDYLIEMELVAALPRF